MNDRVILHCDCNGFFASVEQLSDPSLREVPMAVCGDPDSRHGIILAKNELAKGYHIKTAETIWQTRAKCPQLRLVPPHHDQYEKWSKIINGIYQRYTDQVEPFGIDESWLDVTGSQKLFGSGADIADRLRREVREETGLTISAGVSFNKIFAKLGSDYKKPDATTVITRADVPRIVWPQPAEALLFVGKASLSALHAMGIHTIGDIVHSDRSRLSRMLGRMGEQIWDYACGLDDSPVAHVGDRREIKSVGNGMTFRRDIVGETDARVGILALADEVAGRMRRHGLKCETVQLTIKDPALRVITRQRKLERPTHLSAVLADTCMALLRDNWDTRKPIRMLTVTAQQLVRDEEAVEQMLLFDGEETERRQRQERLERVKDAIRARYGQTAIRSAGLLQNDLGIDDSPEEQKSK